MNTYRSFHYTAILCLFAASAFAFSGCTSSEPAEETTGTDTPLPPPPVTVASADEETSASSDVPQFADEPSFTDDSPTTRDQPEVATVNPSDPATPDGVNPLQLPEPEPVDESWREQWITDFEAAKAQAQAEGKDILVDFTGTEWCMWCIRLSGEVFRHSEFSEYAQKHFVLVECDFPQNVFGQPEAEFPEHQELADRFEIESFPTILLFDAQGRPFAQTGYQPGGPESYNAHLEELRQIRISRDEAFAAAEKLEGIERAKKLDEALLNLPGSLALPSYEPEVEQIITLDADNKAELRDAYAARLANHRFMARIRALEKQIPKAESADPALAEIDRIDADLGDDPRRAFVLNLFRINVLNYFDRIDDVLALADSVLEDETLDTDYRAQLYITQLRTLNQADRLADAVSVTDKAIDQFQDNSAMKMEFLMARADFLVKLDRNEEARTAIKEARKAGGTAAAFRIDQFEEAILGSVSSESEPESKSEPEPASAEANEKKPEAATE